MPLDALTAADEIAGTFALLAARLADGAAMTSTRTVGWQGDSEQHTVYWHPDIGMWGLADDSHATGEGGWYWFDFGDQDPTPEKAGLAPVFQISLLSEGIDRQCAGVFVADDKGRIFIAHNGGVGGGRPGISKSNFWKWYTGPRQPVYGPDKRKEPCVILGASTTRTCSRTSPRTCARF